MVGISETGKRMKIQFTVHSLQLEAVRVNDHDGDLREIEFMRVPNHPSDVCPTNLFVIFVLAKTLLPKRRPGGSELLDGGVYDKAKADQRGCA